MSDIQTPHVLSRRAQFVLVVLALLAPFVATLTVAAPAQAAESVVRVRGEDRVATSVAVARAGWSQASHVLVATARNYPDAVAASAYASAMDAPVLLTEPDALPGVVSEVIGDLGARRVTILGGTAAVSLRVEEQLRGRGVIVDRVAGSSRWATAADLAREVAATNDVDVVAIALGDRGDGKDAWPDALAAASLAGLDVPIPTVLTRHGALPDETRVLLTELRPSKVLVLGGESAISKAVLDQLTSMGLRPERIDGPNRFATSVVVANEAMSGSSATHGDLDPTRLVVVSGAGFADALGAGALAARRGAPLVLVPAGQLADSVDAFIRADATGFTGATVVGGVGAVADFVLEELSAAIAGNPRPDPPCPTRPGCC